MARKPRSTEQRSSSASAPPSNASTARKRKFDWTEGFEVELVRPAKLQSPKKKKKRRVNGASDTDPACSTPITVDIVQPNPFGAGRLSEAYYNVHPSDVWENAARYRTFTNEDNIFSVNQIVFINADPSQDRTKTCVEGWVAKILEVRAVDPNQVFLRVYWMYRPEDLPGGRQPYHGASELIASNDMAIIHALTVDEGVTVIHWQEKADQDEVLKQDQLFWRQTFDVMTGGKLSALPKHCVEKTPCNPDEILVQCESCSSWLHGSCLEREAVRQAYKSHNVSLPEDQTDAKGRVTKKKGGPNSPAFTALIRTAFSGKTCLSVTDQRLEENCRTWNVAVKCLLCHETIEEALVEEEQKSAKEPTPLFENNQQDLSANQENITLETQLKQDYEDSVLGKSLSDTQESAVETAGDDAA